MDMGFAPTWLRQVSPLLHKTTLTTGYNCWSPDWCVLLDLRGPSGVRHCRGVRDTPLGYTVKTLMAAVSLNLA